MSDRLRVMTGTITTVALGAIAATLFAEGRYVLGTVCALAALFRGVFLVRQIRWLIRPEEDLPQ